MSVFDRILERLSGPAGRVLDAPIREVVQEVIRDGGYASPAEVDALRAEAGALKTRADALDARLRELDTLLDAARADAAAARDEASRAREAAATSEARANASDARVFELEQRLASAPAAQVTRAPADEPTLKAAPPRAASPCKVTDCGDPVRSKGFCSAHYQQWRRGTLRGFVGQEGLALLPDGEAVTVSEAHAGASIARVNGKLVVDGNPA